MILSSLDHQTTIALLIRTIHLELYRSQKYINEDGVQETSLDYGIIYLQC